MKPLSAIFIIAFLYFGILSQKNPPPGPGPQPSPTPTPEPIPANCQKKSKVELGSSHGDWFDFGKGLIVCVQDYYICGKGYSRKSEPRSNATADCASFYSSVKDSLPKEVCCDCPRYTIEVTCDCDADGRDEKEHGRVVVEECDPRFTHNESVKCQDRVLQNGRWFNPWDSVGYSEAAADDAYFKMLDETCPVIKCYRGKSQLDAQQECDSCKWRIFNTVGASGLAADVDREVKHCNDVYDANKEKYRQTLEACLLGIKKGPSPRPQPLPTPTRTPPPGR